MQTDRIPEALAGYRIEPRSAPRYGTVTWSIDTDNSNDVVYAMGHLMNSLAEFPFSLTADQLRAEVVAELEDVIATHPKYRVAA